MPSPLFRQLCEQAGRREHALLMTATQIRVGMAGTPGKPWPDLNPMPWRTAGRLARLFLEENARFREVVEQVSILHRFRRRDIPMICPTCMKEDCPEALLPQEMSPAALHKIQQMIMAKLHPPASPW